MAFEDFCLKPSLLFPILLRQASLSTIHNKLAFFYVHAKLDAIIFIIAHLCKQPYNFRLLNVIIINPDQSLFCPWSALQWHLEFS